MFSAEGEVFDRNKVWVRLPDYPKNVRIQLWMVPGKSGRTRYLKSSSKSRKRDILTNQKQYYKLCSVSVTDCLIVPYCVMARRFHNLEGASSAAP